ncbi:MAG: peptidyl-alpha-hydroxyglycine alpha-amidating lyase family protein [Gammaproteobacteria bacterium]|nr:peptidyl-alpha-hydroxyglycine alpha-amidating lyase family protein [Gammaproteobacteria bacterium]MDP2142435.1 peptidyl-alpha-hydroxyglycine alpha-amidating lyase family protein [Gammaproteobacteria bacterium]MDP2348774.1 peptidyl-alpha-hydroxyglycine alpha-amidating lyase family protein [Gammaproteobacteria bacterium]
MHKNKIHAESNGLLRKALAGALLAALPGIVFAQAGARGPAEHANVTPVNNLPNPYETVRNWGTPPAGRTWGSVSAINIDIDGESLWVGDRCGANSCANSTVDPIVKLDKDGNPVLSFGAGLILWPHGMDVDREGNVWVVDARSANAAELAANPAAAGKGHTVLKFSPTGQLLLTLGTAGEAGDPPTHFTEPNDVLIAPDGSIFVAETHGAQFQDEPGPNSKSRISKFAPDGTFIMSFGEWGFEDGQLRSPHSLAMDSQGRLFVADRGNRRIQIFDQQGGHIDTWYQFSRISGLYIDANDMLYAIDSESDQNYNPGWRKGLRVGNARTGEVLYFIPEHNSERPTGMGGIGAMGEGVAVAADGTVYGGEVGPVQGLTKFIPRLID